MSVMGIKHRYADVMKCLTRLILTNASKDEREEAARLKRQIECFEFVLHIVIMSKILAEINIASQYLQSKDADIERATEHLRNAADNLAKMRLNFKTVKEEAISACITWGVAPCFRQKEHKTQTTL
jgi:xylose isomerase